ncbi:hypothetical protein CBR_g50113 [Chara braunii]|uniref:Uncharacterized protein n=1 Tax=Chara braunii TaxID=69332 RepID=A0A388M654_CHABU|nr:hypothetical protein CBR_g50113 [Chara braunii]|eukprot:GBG90020.1 hypothetical protein CBR_g50113 [Chara braunii]
MADIRAEDSARTDGGQRESIPIGIDLGTSFCCVGAMANGKVEIIPNLEGKRITPSYVGFSKEDRWVGEAAKAQYVKSPKNTFFEVKRLIGRKFIDTEVTRDAKRWQFELREGQKGGVVLWADSVQKEFTPEEISAHLLVHMKEIAEKFFTTGDGAPIIKDAVITVPAYFNDAQRQATKDAATIAGLNVLELMNEPTAAALVFAHEKVFRAGKRTVLVFDLGGGTFDVSIMTVDEFAFVGVALAGDAHLGGADFDGRLIDYVSSEFERKVPGSNPRATVKLRRKIREACIQAKIDLSQMHATNIMIENGDDDFELKITRAKFEELNMDLFQKCIDCVERALIDAQLTKEQVTDVVLVGGSSRIPYVQDLLERLMGLKPLMCVHADEAVARGATIQASFRIAKFTQAERPKAPVAPPPQLTDVVPFSIGLDLNNGKMRVLIPKNTKRPAEGKCTLITSRDNQTSMLFPVYQGENEFAVDNVYLGSFTLAGFEPAPRGKASAEVTFSVDENGILSATAEAKTGNVPGRTASVKITADKGRLSDEQMAGIVHSVEEYNRRDRANQARAQEEYERDRTRVRHGSSLVVR